MTTKPWTYSNFMHVLVQLKVVEGEHAYVTARRIRNWVAYHPDAPTI